MPPGRLDSARMSPGARGLADVAVGRAAAEAELARGVGAGVVGRGVDRLEAAVGRDPGQVGQGRREGAEGRRDVERPAEGMVHGDPVQAAPAVVALVGRPAEGGLEVGAGQLGQGGLHRPQQGHVAAVGGVGDPVDGEEVDARGADALAVAEGLQQVLEGGQGPLAVGHRHPEGGQPGVDGALDDLAAPDRVDGGGRAVGLLQAGRGLALAVAVGGVVALGDAGRGAPVPEGQAADRLGHGRVAGQPAQGRVAVQRPPGQRPHQVGDEELGVDQGRVGLDALHVGERHLAAAGQLGPEQGGDAPAADAGVAVVEVVDAAAGPRLVQRVVVQGDAGRVVVGVDEEAGRRVEELRHLGVGEDLVGDGLAGLGVLDRQPLVAAGAVADEERRQAVHGAGLEVLAQRQLGAGEVGDVALDVGIGPVLAADVEAAPGPGGSRPGCGRRPRSGRCRAPWWR